VGCGIATLDGKTKPVPVDEPEGLPGKWYALVCRYSPADNWEGQKPY